MSVWGARVLSWIVRFAHQRFDRVHAQRCWRRFEHLQRNVRAQFIPLVAIWIWTRAEVDHLLICSLV